MGDRPGATYLTGSLIATLVGAVMLLAFDFAGWEYLVPYGDTGPLHRFDSVALFSGPLYFVVVAALGGALLYGLYVSVQGLRPLGPEVGPQMLRRALYAAVAAFAGSLLGGVVFLAVMDEEDAVDWWLDTGFYGGVIASALAVIFFWMALSQARSAHDG